MFLKMDSTDGVFIATFLKKHVIKQIELASTF